MMSGSSDISASSHEVHELELVALADLDVVVSASVEDLAIVLDHHQPRVQVELREQPRDGESCLDAARLAVQRHEYRVAHDRTGSGAAASAAMYSFTAWPVAP